MIKTVYANWWKEIDNFGDLLTPYLIRALSGCEVKHVGYSLWSVIIHILKCIKAGFKINSKKCLPFYMFEREHILCIGSILDSLSSNKSIVWGSGILIRGGTFKFKKILAVRGEYTAKELSDQGYGLCKVLGDPALLLPLVYTPQIHTDNKDVAIIPHFIDYDEYYRRYSANYDIIKLNTDKIEDTIDRLCSYKYVLSSSLHGLIVCHAYRIPAIWIENKPLSGDSFHFKFRDYFSSVGIDYYDPYKSIDQILNNHIVFFESNIEKTFIAKDRLLSIQKGLLSVAPFRLHDKYKQFLQ